MNVKDKGKLGETLTVKYLEEKGVSIIKTNYYSRYGEIDVIASDDKFIMFVEVKLRKEGALVSPGESIVKTKRQKIIKTAYDYLLKNKSLLQPRFDISEVNLSTDGKVSLNYVENAFCQDDCYSAF